MRKIAGLVLALGLVAAPGKLAFAQGAPDNNKPAPAVDPAEKLIADLGADDYQKRDEAQKKLVALGPKALAALQKAEKESKDAEVRARAHEAIAAINKDSGPPKQNELEPDEPKLVEPDDQPQRAPRFDRLFPKDMDQDLPETVRKMLEQIQKQFERFDRESERELRRQQQERGGNMRIQVLRPKTPIEAKLGLAVSPPSPALAAQLDLQPEAGGLVVDELAPNQPAWKAGLKLYDVIVSVDGKVVRTPADLVGLGERESKIEVVRKAKKETILAHKVDDASPERERPVEKKGKRPPPQDDTPPAPEKKDEPTIRKF